MLRRLPVVAATSSFVVVALAAAQDVVYEPGFSISTYATGLNQPVAMEFAPDGRLFVAELEGTVREIDATGLLVDRIVAQVEVYHENENGLLGLALDPNFASNGYIYVFATIDTEEQQILRFTEPGKRTDSANTPVIIRDHLPTRGEFHSGGGLKVGPDNKLYFSIGDNLIPENAQDMNTLAGKISRINLDGSTPDDNPFTTSTGAPRAIFALGFRNPFRFCFAPDGRLFALDVGSDGDGRREEINLVEAGQNYGWPAVEGSQGLIRNDAYTDPIYSYHDGGAAPVGAVYYTGTQFPTNYKGDLFHLEYVLGRLYRTVLDGNKVVGHTTFLETEGGPVDLVQGPDGALYLCELYSGEIKRISWSASAPADGNVVAGETIEDDTVQNQTLPTTCGFGAAFGAAFTTATLFGGRLLWSRRRLMQNTSTSTT